MFVIVHSLQLALEGVDPYIDCARIPIHDIIFITYPANIPLNLKNRAKSSELLSDFSGVRGFVAAVPSASAELRGFRGFRGFQHLREN